MTTVHLALAPAGVAWADTDAFTPHEAALALYADGKRGLARSASGHSPGKEMHNLGRPELEGILSAKLAVGPLYTVDYLARDKARDWSYETGYAAALALIAAARALGEDTRGVCLAGDFEGTGVPHDKALAYATGFRAGLKTALEFQHGAYIDESWPMTVAEWDALGFDVLWQAGSKPRAPAQGYVLCQGWPPKMIGGDEYDEDRAQVDAHGKNLVVLAPENWEGAAPPTLDPALAFREVRPGETETARGVRQLSYMASFPSRPLLEPGVRTVPWTCLVLERATRMHVSLAPEDGWREVVVNGETFGGDPSARTVKGFEFACIPFLGGVENWFGGLAKHNAGKPWPVEPMVSLYTGAHTLTLCFVTEITTDADRAAGERVFRCLIVEGGQISGPCPPGTESWELLEDGTPRELVINDRRHVDHCQRHVREFRQKADGTISGYLGAAKWAHQFLTAPAPVVVAPPPPPPPPPVVVAPPQPTTAPAQPSKLATALHALLSALAAGGVAAWHFLRDHWLADVGIGVAVVAIAVVLFLVLHRSAVAKTQSAT